jgi:hypothetical protein
MNLTPVVSNKEFDNILNRHSEGNSQRETLIKVPPKTYTTHKPNYKSIISITAAIVLQNYWREYQNRKYGRESDLESDKSVIEVISKIEGNKPFDYKQFTDEYDESDIVEDLFDEAKGLSKSAGQTAAIEDEHKGKIYDIIL